MKYKAVTIGASAGGFQALGKIFSKLKKEFMLPIIVVQHTSQDSDNYFVKYLEGLTSLIVKEAESNENILQGHIYIAPPNYHVLIEKNLKLTLSVEKKINYSRPSIDILFKTAAEAYNEELIGIVLTGASSDGSAGLKRIKELGGYTIVQNPTCAESKLMPEVAIETVNPDLILNLEEISNFLNKIKQ